MIDKSKNELKFGVVLSYVQIFVNVIVQLLYTPLLMKFLGKNEYGLYQIVASTISLLSVLNLGFNASYIRYYAKYKKENDEDRINNLNGLFLIIFSILGAVGIACGIFLSLNLKVVFSDGLTVAEYEIARWLMLLFTVNFAFTFPSTVFTCIISAHEKFILLKLVMLLSTIMNPILTIPCLMLGWGSISVVAVMCVVSLTSNVIYVVYVFCNLKCRFRFHNFEKGLFKSLFGFTFFIAFNTIVDLVNGNIGKLMLGRYQGTEMVAVYSVGYTLYSFYLLFSTSISSVFVPRVHHMVNKTANDKAGQRKVLTDLFVRVGRMQFLVLALIASGLIVFGRQFINLWVGSEYRDSYFVALLLILPASIPLIQNLGIEIQRAQNKHRFRSIVYIFMAIVNLFVTWFLCQRYGAIGTAVGTLVSLIVANGLIMNIYYHRVCNIDIIVFWKNIFRLFVPILIPIAVGIVLNKYIDLYKFANMVLGILIYIMVYAASMWFFGMDSYEKSLVYKIFDKLLKKEA